MSCMSFLCLLQLINPVSRRTSPQLEPQYITFSTMYPALLLLLLITIRAISYSEDVDISIRNLKFALENDPTNHNHLRELGLLYMQHDSLLAQHYLGLALQYSSYRDKTAAWNYAVALHFDNKGDEACTFIENFYLTNSKDVDTALLAGRLHLCNGHISQARKRFQEALDIFSGAAVVYVQILLHYEEAALYSEAEDYVDQALTKYPQDDEVMFQAAILLFHAGRVERSLGLFQQVAGSSSGRRVHAAVMAGSALQALGRPAAARAMFEELHDSDAVDKASSLYVSFLANYGLLLKGSGDEADNDRGLVLMQRALDANPFFETVLINLAMHYRDVDNIDESAALLKRAMEVSSNPRQLEIDLAANTMDEVMLNWDRVLAQRREMHRALTDLLAKGPPPARHFSEYGVLNLHFNIQYQSFNDRQLQELVRRVYETNIKDFSRVSPHLLGGPSAESLSSSPDDSQRIIRVGFMSMSFGVFEPHGMLLDGVVKYLPRALFEVFVLRVQQDRDGGEPLTSPAISDHADHVVDVPRQLRAAAAVLQRLQLDVLVFADTLCEQVNHYLMFSRYAKVQILFWGNPITSGSQQVDYFVSGDFMEHPFRARMTASDDPYSEQVVLLPGQAVWYVAPNSSEFEKSLKLIENKTSKIRNFTREEFGLLPSWFLFLCPQNLFKLHVFFDDVIGHILRRSSAVHIVFTVPGRRKAVTQKFKDRLALRLGGDFGRCHFLPRVSSQQFINFIKIGDALLHPFPFDGSRISADCLTAGMPYVTLPAEYLRGRMGASFYRTMDLPELVARNASEYVDIAVRLSLNATFMSEMRDLISERSWLIFDDMEVPFAWSQFLLRVAGGRSAMTWAEFLQGCADRDVVEETRRRSLRAANQRRFDDRWGPEHWLLDSGGRVVLEEDVAGSAPPRIFNDWKNQHSPSSAAQLASSGSLRLPVGAGDEELETVESDLTSFQEYFLSGEHEEASHVGLRLVRARPGDVSMNYAAGVNQLLTSNGDEGALTHCGAAAEGLLEKDEEDARVLACLGVAAARLHLEDLSVFALNRAWELRHAPALVAWPLFSTPAIEYALLSALKTFGRHAECVEVATSAMQLPPPSQGGLYVLVFSAVAWQDEERLQLLAELDTALKRRGALTFSGPEKTLLSETQRVQASHGLALEAARVCCQHLDRGREARKALDLVLMAEILANKRPQRAGAGRGAGTRGSTTNLVLVTVLPSNLSGSLIAQWAQSTLARNLMHPGFDAVHVLVPGGGGGDALVELGLPHASKLHRHVIHVDSTGGHDMKWALSFANANLRGLAVVVAKSHICFDQSLDLIPRAAGSTTLEQYLSKRVLILSEWRSDDSSLELPLGQFSQVAWVFHSPLSDCVDVGAGDDWWSERAGRCGYIVSNPSYFVRAIANDVVGGAIAAESDGSLCVCGDEGIAKASRRLRCTRRLLQASEGGSLLTDSLLTA